MNTSSKRYESLSDAKKYFGELDARHNRFFRDALANGYLETDRSPEMLRHRLRLGISENVVQFDARKVDLFIKWAYSIDNKSGCSPLSQGILNMSQTMIEATESVEKMHKLFHEKVESFKQEADRGVDEAKKRVSQLNDYNTRLAESMSRLSKTMGDKQVALAIENAEKLIQALNALEKLQKNGDLEKIMAALQSKV